MAFKKKKIKKKTKKPTNKNDDWAFEGGTTLTNNSIDNHNEEGAKKERRRTQERDESIRRSRMKGADRKRQISFSNKMSKKIKFNDSNDNSSNHESLENIEDVSSTTDIKGITNDPNPIPAYNRLAMLINKSLDNRSSRDLIYSFINTNDDMINMENNDSNNTQVKSINNIMVDSIELIEDKDVIDDENLDLIDENDEEYKEKNDVFYQHFFNTENIDNDMQICNDKKKLTLLGTIPSNGNEIVGMIHDNLVNTISIKPIPNITMIPGLYKLFSTSNHITFDETSAHLLPYLVSYADAFIEGRDKDNDSNLLNRLFIIYKYFMYNIYSIICIIIDYIYKYFMYNIYIIIN